VSSESNNIHSGFFARIIRDALCTLPDVSSEREPMAFEQQVQAVVEYAESATPVKSPSNLHTQTATQTPNAIAPATVSPAIALQNSPAPAASVHSANNAKTKASSITDQHSIAVALSEKATAPADQSAANSPHSSPHSSPHNHSALVQRQAGKKIPLAISMRDAPHDRGLAATGVAAQKYVTAAAPAAKVDPARVSAEPDKAALNTRAAANVKSTQAEPANPSTQRQTPPTAAPIIAKSALAEHRLPERKAAAPSLRIGAVTIRVVDAAPEPAVSSRASKPTAHSSAVDPIASAESRHFLRTL
jgi:hypothetical protein